jgi:hypothetical protein
MSLGIILSCIVLGAILIAIALAEYDDDYWE